MFDSWGAVQAVKRYVTERHAIPLKGDIQKRRMWQQHFDRNMLNGKSPTRKQEHLFRFSGTSNELGHIIDPRATRETAHPTPSVGC